MKGFNDLTWVRVCAATENVIKKLSKNNIYAFNITKKGAYTHFFVAHNYVEKVFAIFSHPCYNITVIKLSPARALAARLSSRIGVLCGCALFVAAVILSQYSVLKIEVTGSGSYLAPQVEAVLSSCGIKAGSFFPSDDFSEARAGVMSLPSVTFCSFERRGFVLVADVECNPEDDNKADYSPLVSDCVGTIEKITAVCGTPLVSAGDEVSRGDELIGAYYTAEDGEKISCLCVGYARIEVTASVSCHAEERGDKAMQSALAAAKLYAEEIEVVSCDIKDTSDGVIYIVNFTYLHTVSVNMQ